MHYLTVDVNFILIQSPLSEVLIIYYKERSFSSPLRAKLDKRNLNDDFDAEDYTFMNNDVNNGDETNNDDEPIYRCRSWQQRQERCRSSI